MSRCRVPDWIVPPVVVPEFLALLVLDAAVLHG